MVHDVNKEFEGVGERGVEGESKNKVKIACGYVLTKCLSLGRTQVGKEVSHNLK